MSPNDQSQLLEAINQLDEQQIPLVLQFISSLQKNNPIAPASTKHFLEGSGDLSERSARKKIIAEKIRAKHQARHE